MLYCRRMRVKELTLQGFKSFAGRHRFVFPPGITAIVGPNGSGKSNVADAVRWVLGEQRATALRAKKTDEIIFGGTEKRARAGLAEVQLTLDNEDHRLEVEYAEVLLGRRAVRDGTNSYFLNGAPVRLRDVTDLLGSHLGHGGYSVIGQGMVDNALSMRPEERRLLIDEAAGLVPLQRRRDRALGRLAETDENLTRVRDILDELGPRVRRMARLADRAARHAEMTTELRSLLLRWYGHHWHLARAQRDRERDLVAGLRQEIDHLDARRSDDAAGVREREAALAEARRRRDQARSSRESVLAAANSARQEAAVARARLEGHRAREADRTAAAEAEQQAELNALRRIAEIDAELAARGLEADRLHAEAVQARQALDELEARHDGLAAAVDGARATVLQARAERTAAEDRLAAITAERTAKTAELERARQALDRARTGSEALARVASEARAVLDERSALRAEAASGVESGEAELAGLSPRLAEAHRLHAEALASLGAARARSEALEALFGEGGESRQIVSRLAEASGIGVIGSVSHLLRVAEGWQAAVAAALGHQVHGIALRGRSAVSSALALVLRDSPGIVTLVPLDDGERSGTHRPWSPTGRELRYDAVADSAEGTDLARALLGGTAFVEDLSAARAALARADGPSRAATRDGLLVLPYGIVVTHAPARQVLALEHERRSLPVAIEAAEARVASLGAEVDRLEAERSSAEGRLGGLVRRRQELDVELAAAAAASQDALAQSERSAREIEWQLETVERLTGSQAALDADAAALTSSIDDLCTRESAAERDLARAVADSATDDMAGARARVLAASAAASEAAQTAAGLKAVVEATAADLEAIRARMAAEGDRRDASGAVRAALGVEVEEREREAGLLQDRLESMDSQVRQAEESVIAAEHAMAVSSAAMEEASRDAAALENRLAEARVAEAHSLERLSRLGEQLCGDLDVVAPDWAARRASSQPPDSAAIAWSEAGPGAHAPVVSDATDPRPAASGASGQGLAETDVEALAASLLDTEEDLPQDVEPRIAQLRRDMRAIGAVDREALADYHEGVTRLEHLAHEHDDLIAAQVDITAALEQLEAEMAGRFEATFAAVAAAFGVFFPKLFGGGEAELVLEREGDAAGIGILARPPGKRRQPLGLLSGGERSLTAVALIFALLKVSDTPFVVLDEVDAALDEANVARFRSALESLAEDRQVIIITHNRATIQAADTVYGITMSEDGASQVVSLQVPRGR